MNISGKCSLVIKGDGLDKEVIEQTLGLAASRFCKKGESVSKVIGVSPFDVWSYDIETFSTIGIEDAIAELLKRLVWLLIF
ncbi:MAG: DUF4279 domain-containing protein [Clostridiales bacterium]|nr:DUF4279 domain-containing protein [Clostridiales bacterium]